MIKYILTCLVNDNEPYALVFDTHQVATRTAIKIIKSLGIQIKRSERLRVDWDLSNDHDKVSFRLVTKDSSDIQYQLIINDSDEKPETHSFTTRIHAVKYAEKYLHRMRFRIRSASAGSGQWRRTRKKRERLLQLNLIVSDGTPNKDYVLLGITKDTSNEEIKKAYRAKVKSVHPDHGGAEQDMKDLNDAYRRVTTLQLRPDEKVETYHSVSAQFLSNKLSLLLNGSRAKRPLILTSRQSGPQQIIRGIGLIFIGGIVINISHYGTNPTATYIISIGLVIVGIFYLVNGVVNTTEKQ